MYKLLKRSIDKYKDNNALCFYGEKFSFSLLDYHINQVVKSFQYYKIKENDIVCIALPNIPQAIFLIYALNKIGAIACVIHPLGTKRDLNDCIKKVKPKMLIMFDNFADKAEDVDRSETQVIVTKLADTLPKYKKMALNTVTKKHKFEFNDIKFTTYEEFLEKGKYIRNSINYQEKPNNIALILCSGGTTGIKKYVCLTNKNVDCCVYQISEHIPYCANGKTLTVMPIFHGYGLVMGIHTPLHLNITCVLIPRFSLKNYIKCLLKYEIPIIFGTPSLYKKIITDSSLQYRDLSFLKAVFSGGDCLSLKDEEKINKFLKNHNCNMYVRQGYGLTESVVVSTIMPDNTYKPGSIGFPLSGVSVKIVKPNTVEELNVGETGEIALSSNTNMHAYFNKQDETDNILKKHKDGLNYVHTGDLGYLDAEGFLYFKGRIKRMIVTNGYNVYPLELENIIEEHKDVLKCVVIGRNDENRGEIVEAYIKAKTNLINSTSVKEDIVNFIKSNISKYSVPRNIYFVDKIPLTNIGKVDYRKLQQQVAI